MSKQNDEKKYTCEKCGATFADAPALERHKQAHENSKRGEEKEKELQQGTHQPTVKPDISGNPPGGGGPPIMQYPFRLFSSRQQDSGGRSSRRGRRVFRSVLVSVCSIP